MSLLAAMTYFGLFADRQLLGEASAKRMIEPPTLSV